jgi:hypothetical protein
VDPQIGRWWQVDPKIESMEMWSPYASNYDNPIRFNDVLGDLPDQRGHPTPGPAMISLNPATLKLLKQVWQIASAGGAAATGAANAIVSDNLLGIGAKDVSQTGFIGIHATAYQVGQKAGHVFAAFQAFNDMLSAGGATVTTGGALAPVAGTFALYRASTVVIALDGLFSNPVRTVKEKKRMRFIRKKMLKEMFIQVEQVELIYLTKTYQSEIKITI